MVDDQMLSDALTRVLHERPNAMTPPSDLADQIVHLRRNARRRARLGGTAVLVSALAVACGILITSQAHEPVRLTSVPLHLAGYTFRLPRGAHDVSATPAACAVGVAVGYTPGPGEGTNPADEPTIARATTSDGGCVSMLLTDPYTPGAANAPQEPFTIVDQHAIQIGSYSGTVGTYEVVGSGITPGSDMTINGTPVPSGTQHVELNVQVPDGGGQVQDLQVAMAGLSEQQLVAIVSSGLTAQANPESTG